MAVILEFHNYTDVDISKMIGIYQESINDQNTDQWTAEADFCQDLMLFFKCDGARLMVCCLDGAYVAAVRLEPYCGGLLISCLETKPSKRRRGYAENLMRFVFEKHPGVFYAHVAKRNQASIQLHKKLGFQVYLDHATFVDGSVYANCYTLKRS